ncbi:hypothetical protein Tco_0873610 [Tanacetum coccineum]|uniref:Uncharacterized protein n=1 Tax=Tanacetum coccineum TaxID=301880 RepID=A0ABQ5BPX7_9ASTR
MILLFLIQPIIPSQKGLSTYFKALLAGKVLSFFVLLLGFDLLAVEAPFTPVEEIPGALVKFIFWCSTYGVILFGIIPTTIPDTTPFVIPPTTHIDTTPIPTDSPTIPSSPDYTPASPDYSLVSDMEFDPSKDPSSDHIPPLPATSPFLSSTDDSSNSDIPDTPPSPTYGTPFTETALST